MKQNDISLILDSGAFSAWTRKSQIDIDEYIRFCKDNLSYIDYIVNLDVIPGSPGQKNLPAFEIERSASKGYENYLYLIKSGLPKEKIIHVFHQGEKFKWLKKMVAEMEYIGLSPANDRTTSEKIVWLDLCMRHVLDKQGMPIVKFHGFAVTSLVLLVRYPWYSVDSTSWCMTSRLGAVYVPRRKDNKWCYRDEVLIVSVSSRSPNKQIEGKHIDFFPPEIKKEIFSYFEEKGYCLGKSNFRRESKNYKLKKNERWFGKEVEGFREVEEIEEQGLCNNYKERDNLNIDFFLDFEKNQEMWPWSFKKLFNRNNSLGLIE